MNVLGVYGSKRGGTAELAAEVGDGLSETGGDWRDFEAARGWGLEVGEALSALPAGRAPSPVSERGGGRRTWSLLATLCLFSGVTAMAGGLDMVLWPRGGPWFGLALPLLEGTPFADFLVPGPLLFGVVGLLNVAAGVAALSGRGRPRRWASPGAVR